MGLSDDPYTPRNDDTQISAPVPNRPRLGWAAWEATIGHIQTAHSADATLTLSMYPLGEVVAWGASLTWGQHQVSVIDKVGLSVALSDLWAEVERTYERLLVTFEAVRRRPAGYSDDAWLDTPTLDMISRLVGVTATVFGADWWLMVSYRPTEEARERVVARLVARNGTIARGGRGATLREACRDLYHNSVGEFVKAMRARGEDVRHLLED